MLCLYFAPFKCVNSSDAFMWEGCGLPEGVNVEFTLVCGICNCIVQYSIYAPLTALEGSVGYLSIMLESTDFLKKENPSFDLV